MTIKSTLLRVQCYVLWHHSNADGDGDYDEDGAANDDDNDEKNADWDAAHDDE